LKTVAFRYDAGIVTTIDISHDEYHFPKTGVPVRVDRLLKFKKSLSAVPLRGHVAGIHRRKDYFHGSGVNRIDLYVVYKEQIFISDLSPSDEVARPPCFGPRRTRLFF